MVALFIDYKEEQINLIWYHHQKISKPGGHKYSFHISLSEDKIIRKLEELVEVKIDDADFCNVLKTFQDSFYNPITLSLNIIEREKRIEIQKAKWVLNNVHNVYINDGTIILEGDASEVLEKFS